MKSEVITMNNTNVLPYPEEILQQLNVFRPRFTKPQFNNFCQLTSGIILSSYSAVSRISQMFQVRDQSSLNRFLTESPWNEKPVKTTLHKMIFRTIPNLNIFIGDDTLSEKPFARKMQGAASQYSSMQKRNVNGHSIVTCGYHHENGFVPFDSQLYYPQQTVQKLGYTFQTKNDIMCQKITAANKVHKPGIMLLDSWYSNDQVLGKLHELGIHYVTQIKSNRNVTMRRRKRHIANHAKDIDLANYILLSLHENLFRVHETEGFISKLGTVKIVICQMLLENEKHEKYWSDLNYIITDMLKLFVKEVIELYLKRFSIEVFHREAKQQLGLDAYQLCNIRGIERYLFLVLLAYALLVLLNQSLMQGETKSKNIGELRVYLKEWCYTTLLTRAKIQKIEERRLIARKLAIAF